MVVNRKVSLWSIAKATDISIDVLTLLNPSYKNQMILGSSKKPKKLIIPEIKPYIYTALTTELLKTEPVEGDLVLSYVIPESEKPKTSGYVPRNVFFTYKVQDGDTLESIAEKFNGTEEEIKILNKLKYNSVKPGMILRIRES
jgi:membrane-bound lytic murein transglycosylase D